MRITPNVYLLSGFAYGLHPNAYGVTIPGDEEHMILIDTGLAEPDRMMIEKNRAFWGLDKRKISHVLLTHSHFDHSGNALYYYEQGAKIVMSEADAIAVASGNSRTIDYAYAEKFPACPVDIRVKDGEVLDFDIKLSIFKNDISMRINTMQKICYYGNIVRFLYYISSYGKKSLTFI